MDLVNLVQFIDGYKVYVVGLATIAYAWGSWQQGAMDANKAMDLTLAALTAMGFRSALKKMAPKK